MRHLNVQQRFVWDWTVPGFVRNAMDTQTGEDRGTVIVIPSEVPPRGPYVIDIGSRILHMKDYDAALATQRASQERWRKAGNRRGAGLHAIGFRENSRIEMPQDQFSVVVDGDTGLPRITAQPDYTDRVLAFLPIWSLEYAGLSISPKTTATVLSQYHNICGREGDERLDGDFVVLFEPGQELIVVVRHNLEGERIYGWRLEGKRIRYGNTADYGRITPNGYVPIRQGCRDPFAESELIS